MTDRSTDTDQAARRSFATLGAPGAALALVTPRGERSFTIGHADLHGRELLADEARFLVYSVTKTLIAAAVLTLVQQGRVSLDAPLPIDHPSARAWPRVTVRQALNHTGGLPDYGALAAYRDALLAHPREPWSSDDVLDHTLPLGLLFTPGERFAYSNVGYLLLKRLVEHVANAPLRDVLHDRLFAPLGLTRTAVVDTLDDTASLTPGHSAFWSRDALEAVTARYHPGWVAHGVVASTATELARLVHAVLTGVFFGASLLRAMTSPVLVGGRHAIFHEPAYGLGLMIAGRAPNALVGHAGGGPGYSAGALHARDALGGPCTAVALVNADADEAGLRLAAVLVGAAPS